jgi:hypothetical protein
MAAKKFKPFPVLKADKLPVYNALCEVGHSVKSITDSLAELSDPAIPQGMLKLFRVQAEALGAGIAHLLTGVMHRRESVDWYQFGQQTDMIEQRSKSRK